MKNRAVVFTGKGRVEVQEVPFPVLKPGEVLVRAHRTGVSVGTERCVLNDRFKRTGHLEYPLIPGYQRAGWVEAVGKEVTEFQVGQRVVGTGCPVESGPRSHWAGHMEYGVHPPGDLYPIPENVSFDSAAQLVVAQVGFNAATRWPDLPGKTVMVLGDGCIGQIAAQSARALGARVVLAGRRPERLALARQFSADEVISTRDDKWLDRLNRPDSPVAVVIDTVQDEAFFDLYKLSLPRKTHVVLSGYSPWGFKVDFAAIHSRELGLLCISGWTAQKNRAALELMAAGKIEIEGLLSHRVPAEQAPAIYEMIDRKSVPFLAINFQWQ